MPNPSIIAAEESQGIVSTVPVTVPDEDEDEDDDEDFDTPVYCPSAQL